jgi:antitoxin (DNA-binding transcriptional repressor) of toxin-antitoxin stability system
MKTVVHRIPLTKARINLGQVVRRVHVNREYFILEKDGIPVAGIMNVDDMEDYLELQDESLKEQIKTGYQDYLGGRTRDVRDFLKELQRPAKKAKKHAAR